MRRSEILLMSGKAERSLLEIRENKFSWHRIFYFEVKEKETFFFYL